MPAAIPANGLLFVLGSWIKKNSILNKKQSCHSDNQGWKGAGAAGKVIVGSNIHV